MRRFVILIFLIIIALSVIFYNYLDRIVPKMEPTYSKIELKSDEFDESIFIKRKAWGIGGNGQLFVVSASSDAPFKANAKQEYIFSGFQTILYKFENDTLRLYLYKPFSTPDNFDSKIVVFQERLDVVEMLELLDTYEEKNVKLLSR